MSAETIAIAWAFLVSFGLGYGIYRMARKSSIRTQKRDHDKRDQDDIRRIRDHQLNHGRRVYKWLCGLGFPDYISIEKIEDNGGRFSIFISRVVTSEGDSDTYPIVQLNYGFVEKFGTNCEGHVHYGAYGADAYFRVLEHTNFNFGLENLVVNHVRWDVREYEERLANR